jgi:hypothetical protein
VVVFVLAGGISLADVVVAGPNASDSSIEAIWKAAHDSGGLRSEINAAAKLARQSGFAGVTDGKQDAYRHIIGAAMLSKSYQGALSVRLATFLYEVKPKFTSEGFLLDRFMMDVHNNYLGMNLFLKFGDLDRVERETRGILERESFNGSIEQRRSAVGADGSDKFQAVYFEERLDRPLQNSERKESYKQPAEKTAPIENTKPTTTPSKVEKPPPSEEDDDEPERAPVVIDKLSHARPPEIDDVPEFDAVNFLEYLARVLSASPLTDSLLEIDHNLSSDDLRDLFNSMPRPSDLSEILDAAFLNLDSNLDPRLILNELKLYYFQGSQELVDPRISDPPRDEEIDEQLLQFLIGSDEMRRK